MHQQNEGDNRQDMGTTNKSQGYDQQSNSPGKWLNHPNTIHSFTLSGTWLALEPQGPLQCRDGRSFHQAPGGCCLSRNEDIGKFWKGFKDAWWFFDDRVGLWVGVPSKNRGSMMLQQKWMNLGMTNSSGIIGMVSSKWCPFVGSRFEWADNGVKKSGGAPVVTLVQPPPVWAGLHSPPKKSLVCRARKPHFKPAGRGHTNQFKLKCGKTDKDTSSKPTWRQTQCHFQFMCNIIQHQT